MSGWGFLGSDSKSGSGSKGSSGSSKAPSKGGKTRDPAASAMAASLGIDASMFDLPEEDTSFQMSAEDEARLQEALRLAQEPMDDIDESKISDKDLEDPELLSQLSRIENGDVPDPGPATAVHDADAMDVDEDSSTRHHEQDHAETIAKIRRLEAAIKQDRDAAVQLKRAGKMDDARKALIQMKQRQKQLEDLKILAGDNAAMESSAPARPAVAQPSPMRPQTRPAIPDNRSPSPSLTPTKTPPPKAAASAAPRASPRTNPQSKLVHQRMLEYKQAILEAKESGDVETAQKLFEYFRRLQQIQSDLSENVPVDPSTIPPSPPADPSLLPPLPSLHHQIPTDDDDDDMDVVSTGAGQPDSGGAGQTDADLKRLKTFALLENMLVKQITAYHNRALQEKNAGRKMEAINFLRQKKQWTGDLDLIRLAQASGAPTPLYHIETIEHKTEIIHEDISQHEMEIEIVRLIDVKPPSLEEKTLDLFVTCEIQYPNPDKPQKIQTETAKQSLSPQMNFKHKMRIERNPNFQRFLKNRRLSFEVFRPGSWFLGRATSIGKSELKLADLLEKSEITQQIDIFEGRKVNGGKIEVRVRLRTPANPQSKHYKISQEKLLIIDKHFSASDKEAQQPVAAASPARPVAASAVATPEKPVVKEATPLPLVEPLAASTVSSPGAGHPVLTTQPLSQSTPVSPTSEPANALPDYESLDWIVSNAVMEAEVAKTQQQIDAAKAAGQEVSIDLELRLQQLNMKMEILIIQIQQGQVTVESYMEMLQKKIPEEKALAVQLKRMGKLEEAKQALLRAKLMEREASGE